MSEAEIDKLMRIRERAYQIWEEEGQPEGRNDIHWRRATEEFEAAAERSHISDDQLIPSKQKATIADGKPRRRSAKRRLAEE